MIVGRIWSLNKPRKGDKVKPSVLVGFAVQETELEYTSGISVSL